MARHGGRAAGIVRIQEATFDGCLSTLAGGRLAMNIRGSFAGTPFSGSVDLDSRNLAAGMTHLASTLMDKKAPRATMSNGRCTRPNVPRPNIGSGGVALKIANQQKTAKKAKPRPKKQSGSEAHLGEPACEEIGQAHSRTSLVIDARQMPDENGNRGTQVLIAARERMGQASTRD